MRNVQTIIIAFFLIVGGVFCFSPHHVVVAQDDYGLYDAANTAKLADKTVAGYNTVPGVIGGLIKIGLGALGILFFLMVLYAGFLWMTSMGNTEKTESAKAIVESAAIGLILVVGSYAIATFVFDSLESGTGETSSSAPITQGKCTAGVQEEGDVCDLNSYCVLVNRDGAETLDCLSDCQTKYFGTCGTPESCSDPSKIELNYCPGGKNNVCCKP